jgi:hypothetical protein
MQEQGNEEEDDIFFFLIPWIWKKRTLVWKTMESEEALNGVKFNTDITDLGS